jgi:hypothetical protein
MPLALVKVADKTYELQTLAPAGRVDASLVRRARSPIRFMLGLPCRPALSLPPTVGYRFLSPPGAELDLGISQIDFNLFLRSSQDLFISLFKLCICYGGST